MFAFFNRNQCKIRRKNSFFKTSSYCALGCAINSCKREGSLDATITEVVANDIQQIMYTYPSIRLIACNGSKSYQFTTYVKQQATNSTNTAAIKLPSTSLIPGRYNQTLEGKIIAWEQILKYF